MIKVQITDDHRMLVEGLTKIINESGFAKVIATAGTAMACRKMLAAELPDVLLLDIHLPDGNGIDLCSELLAKYRGLKILALTSFREFAIVNRMLDAGVLGYVLKNATSEEVLMGIQIVAGGERFLCDEVILLLKKQSPNTVVLTKNEQELLKHICEGYNTAEIAERMFRSFETINTYRRNLLFKLNAKNTAALVKMAIEQKLV